MKQRVINTIFLILTITMMVVIFLFSSQNGEKSGETSTKVVKFILAVFGKSYDLLNDEEKEGWSFVIRKLAHFSEFFLLGTFSFSYLNTKINCPGMKRSALYSSLFGLIYSISDETHQFFLDGRVMSIVDVLIDTTGVISGVLITRLIFHLIRQ